MSRYKTFDPHLLADHVRSHRSPFQAYQTLSHYMSHSFIEHTIIYVNTHRLLPDFDNRKHIPIHVPYCYRHALTALASFYLRTPPHRSNRKKARDRYERWKTLMASYRHHVTK